LKSNNAPILNQEKTAQPWGKNNAHEPCVVFGYLQGYSAHGSAEKWLSVKAFMLVFGAIIGQSFACLYESIETKNAIE